MGIDKNGKKILGALIDTKNGSGAGALSLFKGGSIIVKHEEDPGKDSYINSDGIVITDEKNNQSVMHSVGIGLTNKKNNKQTIEIYSGDEGSGSLRVYDSKGEEAAYIGGNSDGSAGYISIHNSKGEEVVQMGQSDNADGLILLNDRYGDNGWLKSGKR